MVRIPYCMFQQPDDGFFRFWFVRRIWRRHHDDLAVAHLHGLWLPVLVHGKAHIAAVVVAIHGRLLPKDIGLARCQLVLQLKGSCFIGRPFSDGLAGLINHLEGHPGQGFACNGIHLADGHVGRSIFHDDRVARNVNLQLHAFRNDIPVFIHGVPVTVDPDALAA